MISVIVCTRNRSESLGRTLAAMRCLASPKGVPWELVVVDNGSTDATKAVVTHFMETSGLDVQYVQENRKGLSHARNTGLSKARGEIIAFTDDDVLVNKEWLVQIAEECSEHPTVAMYFGQTRRSRPGEARIAVKEKDKEETYVFPCELGYPGSGNNMIFRRSILSSVGSFDTTLGAGTEFPAEDLDFAYRVLRSGGTIRYAPKILVVHDHDRLSSAAIRSVMFGYLKGKGGFYCKHILRGDRYIANQCYTTIRNCLQWQELRWDFALTCFRIAGIATGFGLRLGSEAKALMQRLLSKSDATHREVVQTAKNAPIK